MVRVGVDPRVQISATSVLFFWGGRGGAVSGGKRPGYTGLGSRVVSAGLRRRTARVQIAAATLSGNSLRQTVHTHHASLCSRSSEIGSSPLKACYGNCRPGGK